MDKRSRNPRIPIPIIAMVILYFAIPRVKGDAPIPLRQQLSLLKKPKVALGLAITFFCLEDIRLHIRIFHHIYLKCLA